MSPLHSQELYFEVKSFQAQEIAFLQRAAYEDWLQLFTADIRYRVPVITTREGREGTESQEDELAYFDDTFGTLKLRVARAKSRMAWTEIPPSRMRYFLEPYSISREGDEVAVTSNFMIYQTRLQREENYFVGYRRDRLRNVDSQWKIAERVAVIEKAVLPSKNITIFF